MWNLANKLAGKIAANLQFDAEKESVIAYGLTAIIQIISTLLLVMILGCITHSALEALVVCFAGSSLRRSSGGAHVSTAEVCTVFSAIYCVAAGFAAKTVLLRLYNPLYMLIFLCVCYALSCTIVVKYAPVDTANKPIRSEKKRQRLRKASLLTLAAYAVISAVLYLACFLNNRFGAFGIALVLGLSWQIFTLTPFGGKFVHGINNLFTLFQRR